jgi:hypothetical protein
LTALHALLYYRAATQEARGSYWRLLRSSGKRFLQISFVEKVREFLETNGDLQGSKEKVENGEEKEEKDLAAQDQINDIVTAILHPFHHLRQDCSCRSATVNR